MPGATPTLNTQLDVDLDRHLQEHHPQRPDRREAAGPAARVAGRDADRHHPAAAGWTRTRRTRRSISSGCTRRRACASCCRIARLTSPSLPDNRHDRGARVARWAAGRARGLYAWMRRIRPSRARSGRLATLTTGDSSSSTQRHIAEHRRSTCRPMPARNEDAGTMTHTGRRSRARERPRPRLLSCSGFRELDQCSGRHGRDGHRAARALHRAATHHEWRSREPRTRTGDIATLNVDDTLAFTNRDLLGEQHGY